MDPLHSESPATSDGLDSRPKREHRFVLAALVLAAIAPFARAIGFGFVYDDTWIVQHNAAIVGWRSLFTLWRLPYWTDAEGAQAGLYRPVHTAVLAIIRNLLGGWPLWFHLYAILLHAAVTVLVWLMLSRAVRRWPAALGALWFAVHPVHVEAVANISNSAEPLAALWTLGLYFVLARSGDRDLSWRDALLCAALFLLAMLSKESGAMSLPLALLCAEAWASSGETTSRAPAPNTWRPTLRSLWRRWHRVAVVAVPAIAVVGIARVSVLGGSFGGAEVSSEHLSFMARVARVLSLGPLAFGLLGWPRFLNPRYGPSAFPSGPRALVGGSLTAVVLTLAVLGAAKLARRSGEESGRDTRPLTAIGWMLLAFLPAANLLSATGPLLAERTLYLPSIGAAMLIAWGIDRLTTIILRHRATGRAGPMVATLGVAFTSAAIVAICVRFAVVTQRGTEAWRSHRALIEQMIAADPGGYRGHYFLAVELRSRGSSADSIAKEFAAAYHLYQRDAQLNLDYARFLLQQKQPMAAVQVTGTLMDDSRMQNDAEAIAIYLEARGSAYGADSVVAAASQLYRRRPHPTAALYLGLAHEARGERSAALDAYRAGLRVAPGDSALTVRAKNVGAPLL